MIFRIVLFIAVFTNGGLSQSFEQKLYPADPRQGSYFGRFVAQNDKFLAISAYKDSEKASSSGAIYIFQYVNDYCIQSQKIFPDDGTVEQFFGYSLGLSDDWLIAGAHHDSSKGASSGAAYIMRKNSNDNWVIVQKLVPDDLSEGDEFGKKVDISGNFVVSGSYLNDEGGINSGVVYIFKLVNNVWTELTKLYPSTQLEYSQFGLSLDLDKDKLIVGAPFEGKKEHGAAYVFEYTDGKWTETAKLVVDDLNDFDQFGTTVKIKNKLAYVSSTKKDFLGENSGAVYVFKKDFYGWKFYQKLLAPDGQEGDNFGIDIEPGDSILAIGAYFDDDNGQNSGSVYLYKYYDEKWVFDKKLTPDDGEESDAFGSSISVFKNKLVVGAYSDSDKGFLSGSAYVFSLNNMLNNDNLHIEKSIKVYPNIVKENITIENKIKHLTIYIYNTRGRIVKTQKLPIGKIKIDFFKYKRGLYLLKAVYNGIVYTFRLVKV